MKKVKNQKGIALLVALSAVLIMTFLAVEVGYNTAVELAVNVTQMDRLKAYYLAKSGIKISLLRIKIYKTVQKQFGSVAGKDRNLIDMIWSFPLMWPPTAAASAGLVDKAEFKKAVDKSIIEGSFITTIEPEGNKIDLTDLISPSKILRESAYNQLLQMIQNYIDTNDDWKNSNQNIRPDVIVGNIVDWMDEDTTSLNGGDENSYYSGFNQQIKPPNRPLKTLEELHMIAGVTDDIYKILIPRVTLYGIKGIDVNLASKEVLKSIDKQIDDNVADKIIARRSNPDYGPFTNLDDFTNFLKEWINTSTFNQKPPVPLFFDSEFNFRIKSQGIYHKAHREIFAIVYDFDKVKEQLVAVLPPPAPPAAPGDNQPPAAPDNTAKKDDTAAKKPNPSSLPSGPPQIVFWQED